MATWITAVLEDDLDGGRAAETVLFAIGGTGYEIDLNANNAAAFRRPSASSSTARSPVIASETQHLTWAC